MAPKTAQQEALTSAIYVPPGQTLTALTVADPVISDGCTLQPPPTTVKVGPVFSFNLADWKKARAQPPGERELTFKIGLPSDAAHWTIGQYGKISLKRLKTILSVMQVEVAASRAPIKGVVVDGKPGLKIGTQTFLTHYKGFDAPWPPGALPKDLASLFKLVFTDGYYLLWKELIDGKIPVAKVEPPFDDSNHDWALRVGLSGRKVIGVDVATGQPQDQLEATVVLARLPRGVLGTIEAAIGGVFDIIKSVLAVACKLITLKKLQDVRNYGTLFPNPTVQGVMLAWQGAAQACGMVLPANASGKPDCGDTGAAADLPGPEPWWKIHQAWLIGGGIAAAGAAGIAYYLRQTGAWRSS